MGIRWLGLWGPLGWAWQWPLRLWGHVGLLIWGSSLGVWGRSWWRVRLPCVRCLATLLSWWRLGVGGLLLAWMRTLARLAIIW